MDYQSYILRKKRMQRVFMLIVCFFALVLMLSLSAYLYGISDSYDLKDYQLDFVDGQVYKLTQIDYQGFLQIKDDDYSEFDGLNVTKLVKLEPATFGYDVVIEDNSVAMVKSGVVYGLKPGITRVSIITINRKTLGYFQLEVHDFKGNLYYNVEFDYITEKKVYQVISGSSMFLMGIEQPELPIKRGYLAKQWQLDGKRFFTSEIVTQDLHVNTVFESIDISLPATITPKRAKYMTDYILPLTQYLADTSDYEFALDNPLDDVFIDENGLLTARFNQVYINGDYLEHTLVPITVTDKNNLSVAKTTLRILVEPVEVTPVFIGQNSFVYNGQYQTMLVTLTGLDPSDVGRVEAIVSYGNGTTIGAKVANVYTATVIGLSGNKAHCYIIKIGMVYASEMIIAPLLAQIEFISSEDSFALGYSGVNKSISARVSNLCQNDICEVELAYNRADRVAIWDGYIAQAVSLSNENYYLPETRPTQEFSIIKAKLTVVIGSYESEIGQSFALNVERIDGFAWDTDAIVKKSVVDVIRLYLKIEGIAKPGVNTITLDMSVENHSAMDGFEIVNVEKGEVIFQ